MPPFFYHNFIIMFFFFAKILKFLIIRAYLHDE